MNRLFSLVAGTLLTLYAVVAVASAQSSPTIYVVAGPGTSLTAAEIKEVFLGDKTFSASTSLVPIDNLAVREVFLAKVLGVNAAKYESIWTKKAFRDALNPPKTLDNDSAVLDYVKRTVGALGYVTTTPVGVTVVAKY